MLESPPQITSVRDPVYYKMSHLYKNNLKSNETDGFIKREGGRGGNSFPIHPSNVSEAKQLLSHGTITSFS